MKKKPDNLIQIVRLLPSDLALVRSYAKRRGFKKLETALAVLIRMGARRSLHNLTYNQSTKGRERHRDYVEREHLRRLRREKAPGVAIVMPSSAASKRRRSA